MTRRQRLTRQRLLRWLSPYRELLQEERRRSAALRDVLRTMTEDHKATVQELQIDLAVEHARWALAETQRDRARDLVAALLGKSNEFSAGDLAWLDEHGVGAE